MDVFKDNFLGYSTKMAPVPLFHTSDGRKFRKFKSAYRYEMFLHIWDYFPESAFATTSRLGGGPKYHISRRVYLKCGIYRLHVESGKDVDILNYFFRGLRDELPEFSESDYPWEFDLEIYYEKHPGVMIQKAQWRLYDKGRHVEPVARRPDGSAEPSTETDAAEKLEGDS